MINNDFYLHYVPLVKSDYELNHAVVFVKYDRHYFEDEYATPADFIDKIKTVAIQNWGLSQAYKQYVKVIESLSLVDFLMVLTSHNDIDETTIKGDISAILFPDFCEIKINDNKTLQSVAPIFIARTTDYTLLL
jgi:hypothetical protein